MAPLLGVSALLALLPALAGASEPAATEAESGECTDAMRVEFLQRSQRSSLGVRSNRSDMVRPLSFAKSTVALSDIHVGKSMAFKRFFFPVISEQESVGTERPEFLELVKKAIESGAALPDAGEYSSERFDEVSWKEDCGKAARMKLSTVLGQGDTADTLVEGGNMQSFSIHGICATGYGNGTGSHREVDGLKVRHVERIFQEELGSMDSYSPWMDMHVALWDNDLDGYVHKFLSYGVPVLALRWPGSGELDTPSVFYSIIVHVPDTQEVIELVSATEPTDPRVVVQEFPMTRHVFQANELIPLTTSTGMTQLHISRSHYDLDAVKTHYEKFWSMKPVHEMRDAETGVSFVSFWHQSVIASAGTDVDLIRSQVMYWNRPDQKTVAHTTAWLEHRLEHITSKYLRAYSCWPVWGDNHYTITESPDFYFNQVKGAYDAAGIGYMIFRQGLAVFTGYFPLPGGMYIELQAEVDPGGLPAAPETPIWNGADLVTGTGAEYCYRFTCPS